MAMASSSQTVNVDQRLLFFFLGPRKSLKKSEDATPLPARLGMLLKTSWHNLTNLHVTNQFFSRPFQYGYMMNFFGLPNIIMDIYEHHGFMA